MKNKPKLSQKIVAFVGSNKFFWLVVGLLVIQAAWIALSGRYPMAFDEDFHLGLIKIYSDHLSPFWNGQVVGGDAFGAVARDPSYMYHYLMSFPYRLIEVLTANLTTQVLILRALNIGFFVGGLVIYRRLLAKTKASNAVVNVCLLVFVLIPVTPLLAAQINYDNVILPLVGIALLAALSFNERTTNRYFDLKGILLVLGSCLLASTIKYAFLPIFIAIAGFCLVVVLKRFSSFKKLLFAIRASWAKTKTATLIVLIVLNAALGVLFVERYGLNIVRYHKPVPDCAEVLDYQHCQYYGPWIRDYNFQQQKGDAETSINNYSYDWLKGMWMRSFFAVDGPTTGFQTRGPLTIPGWSGIVFGIVGPFCFVIRAKSLWRTYHRPALWLLSSAIVIYSLVLFLTNYSMYLETARPVAINGRYLLPIMPFMILFSALAVRDLTMTRQRLQIAIASIVILCFAWGGGAMTYVLRSNDAWYWQGNQTIKTVNHGIKRTIGPLTPGYNYPTQFLN